MTNTEKKTSDVTLYNFLPPKKTHQKKGRKTDQLDKQRNAFKLKPDY